MLISSWKAPKEGGWLRHLHSFSENFWGSNGHVVRRAHSATSGSARTPGAWNELTTASFSHDPTGKADRLDRFMGVEDGQFFLSHGGFVEGFTPYGEKFSRPATCHPPSDVVLPTAPQVDPQASRPDAEGQVQTNGRHESRCSAAQKRSEKMRAGPGSTTCYASRHLAFGGYLPTILRATNWLGRQDRGRVHRLRRASRPGRPDLPHVQSL